jgi:hypothetical protein
MRLTALFGAILQLHLVANAQFLFPRATTSAGPTIGTTPATTATTAPDLAYLGFSSIGATYSQIDCDSPFNFRNFGNLSVAACCIPKSNCNPVVSCTSGSVAVFKDNSQSTW